jgi:UDP-N-acetylmuramoyl-tripeptide--D-alanyl-D-alanine ligase
MAKRFQDPVFYPAPGDFYHCALVEVDPFVVLRAENGEVVKTNLIGQYNFENIAAALCMGKYFGVDASEANQAVAGYSPGNMRSQVVRRGTNTIILDAYNANPSSMQAALENLAVMKAPRKVIILGDMFELEDEAGKEHTAIGKLIREKEFKEVYLCGSLFKSALGEIPWAMNFEKKELLAAYLRDHPIENATILVKASRGIGLETIVDYL